jgi:hypothetical protein
LLDNWTVNETEGGLADMKKWFGGVLGCMREVGREEV